MRWEIYSKLIASKTHGSYPYPLPPYPGVFTFCSTAFWPFFFPACLVFARPSWFPRPSGSFCGIIDLAFSAYTTLGLLHNIVFGPCRVGEFGCSRVLKTSKAYAWRAVKPGRNSTSHDQREYHRPYSYLIPIQRLPPFLTVTREERANGIKTT